MKMLMCMALTLLLEALSLFVLFDRLGLDDESLLLVFWGLHALASIAVAHWVWLMLPAHWQMGSKLSHALFFSFAFFIPLLGVLGLLVVLLLAVRYPKNVVADYFKEIREPQYLMTMRESQELPDIRAAHARHILRDPLQSIDNKLRVMLALQHMRPKVSVPLLQSLLSDPVEDLRLLAYSMLEAWEKDLARRIGQTQQALTQARDKKSEREMVNAHQKLAELYWEQVDTGLARGDLRIFALEQAKEQCEQALSLDARLAGHWLLYGQVLMELGHIAGAEKAFRLARRTGLPDLAVMPYLARIAWELGRPSDVAAFLKRIRKTAHLPQGLYQVVQFWASRSSGRSRL
jgi:polysaccharide biosynthesis protein PelE